jgi:hypothetical protein
MSAHRDLPTLPLSPKIERLIRDHYEVDGRELTEDEVLAYVASWTLELGISELVLGEDGLPIIEGGRIMFRRLK